MEKAIKNQQTDKEVLKTEAGNTDSKVPNAFSSPAGSKPQQKLTTAKMLSKLVSHSLIAPVRFYQLAISPLLGKNCRHVPSCSQYTIEAIREWGPVKGSWMGAKRISRCHPWGTHGYDPVPKNLQQKES